MSPRRCDLIQAALVSLYQGLREANTKVLSPFMCNAQFQEVFIILLLLFVLDDFDCHRLRVLDLGAGVLSLLFLGVRLAF